MILNCYFTQNKLYYKLEDKLRKGKGNEMRIQEGARIIVEKWLCAKEGDVIHFISDETKLREIEAFMTATEQVGAFPEVTILPADSIQAGDSIEDMRYIMADAAAIVGATNFSFITTNAVRYALSQGARFLSLPMAINDGTSLLEQEFLKMDPNEAERLAKPMLEALECGTTIHVTTKLGTDITFSIQDRTPGLFNGLTDKPGVCSSASFEVYISPVETKTKGHVVLDGSMGYIGLVEKPLDLEFANGKLIEIEDTVDGRKLRSFMESFDDRNMYCAAEFGIGLNQFSRCRGSSYIEDESTYGTFHIGFGRNLALGGNHDARGHFDIVIHNPTIMVDEKIIMENGNVCNLT